MEETGDVIVICFNDEHFSKSSFGIALIVPHISIDSTALKISLPNEVTEDGIVIFANDEHP